MSSVLFENCLLTRPSVEGEAIPGAWMFVEGAILSRSGKGKPPKELLKRAERRVDLEGKRVLPGFVNAHTHLYSALAGRMPWPNKRPDSFRGILEQVWWRLDRALDERSLRISARLGLAEALRHGTTTLVDHHSSPGISEGALAIIAEEAEQLGMKVALAVELSDRNGEEIMEDALDENLRGLQNYADHDHLRGLFGLHASFTVSDDSIDRFMEVIAFETPFHLHCAEGVEDLEHAQAQGFESVVDRLAAMGLLRPGTILAHGVHMLPGDTELIREMGAFIVHCPQSNAHNQVGVADVGAMLGSGVKVGLGTDGFPSGMLTEAQFARDTGVGHGTLTPGKVGELLFLHNPAIATSIFGHSVGRLADGEEADFLVMEPTEHLLDPGTKLLRVVSRGRTVFEKGDLLDLDLADLRREADGEAKRVWKRIGAL